MSQLPQDLIVYILAYLPVKTLLRFKCVSKSWFSLISSSQFTKLHLKHVKEERNINHHSKVLLSTWPDARSVDYEAASDEDNYQLVMDLNYPQGILFRPNFFYVEILGSCNGLVCLCNENDDIVLWNPTTRVSMTLPKPGISLGFVKFSGLGYDESTNDYKLIVASEYIVGGARETSMEVFTLKSNKWKKFEDSNNIIPTIFSLGIYLNQSLYWLVRKESSNTKSDEEIIAFDMIEEKFKKLLPLPDNCKNQTLMTLGTLRNRLCVFSECQGSSFEALVLNGFNANATWSEVFKVSHDTFGGYVDIPLCVTNKGKVVIGSDGWLLELYNPSNSRLKSFEIRNDNGEFDAAVYLETLVSPYN